MAATGPVLARPHWQHAVIARWHAGMAEQDAGSRHAHAQEDNEMIGNARLLYDPPHAFLQRVG